MSETEHSQEWYAGYDHGVDAFDNETDAAARRFHAYLLATTLASQSPYLPQDWKPPETYLDTWAQWYYQRVYGTAMPAPKVQEQRP